MLPDGYQMRPARVEDLSSWLDVTLAVDAAEIGEPDYTEDDVRADWARPRFDLGRDARVVEGPEGRLAGWASVWERREAREFEVDAYVRPELAATPIERTLLAAVHELAAARCANSDAVILVANIDANSARAELIGDLGYSLVRRFYRMAINFDAPPPVPSAPDGVTVRTFRDSDGPAAHRCIESAFAEHWRSEPESYEEWRARFVETTSFDAGLWFVAEVDEDLAGVLIGRSHADGGGWVRDLGVRKEFRGRGVGQALLAHAFTEFYRRGWRKAQLGVDVENTTGATALYERVGMTPVLVIDIYQQPLHR